MALNISQKNTSWQFAQIYMSFIANGSLQFIIKILDTVEFTSHMHGYILSVNKTPTYKRYISNKVLFRYMFSPYHVDNDEIIVHLQNFISLNFLKFLVHLDTNPSAKYIIY